MEPGGGERVAGRRPDYGTEGRDGKGESVARSGVAGAATFFPWSYAGGDRRAGMLSIAPPHELRRPVPHVLGASEPAFLDTMSGLFGTDVIGRNAVRPLVNGDAIFPALLEAIDAAERTITFETFIYWSGSIADRVAEALAARARAGVRVKVLLDWQGSIPMEHRLIELMRGAGVEVVRFRPLTWYTVDRVNNRTHRKIMVVDGRLGFTGGVGVADEWLGDARDPGEWRDTHYSLEGPVVAGLQAAFAENWAEATGEILQGPDYFPPTEPAGPLAAHLVRSSAGQRNIMHMMLMTALAAAEHSIRIGTPYFVPDDVALAQLIEARRRGVEIDVLLPVRHIDKTVVRHASRHFWGRFLAEGVRIHAYDATMYHNKVVIIDEVYVSVGSANFDERSFRLNEEANLSVFDAGFARREVAQFEADLARSRPVTLAEWQARPRREKLHDWLASRLRSQI
jgi:cardiolipin synthase A/B